MAKKEKEKLSEIKVGKLSSEQVQKLKKPFQEENELPAETRGRKPKEICVEDLQNQAKELILSVRAYMKIKAAKGKPTSRLYVAANDLERMVRTHLID